MRRGEGCPRMPSAPASMHGIARAMGMALGLEGERALLIIDDSRRDVVRRFISINEHGGNY
jgi:hypothetical protein